MSQELPRKKKKKQLSTAGGFVGGGLAACGAVTLTNPIELVKTRLQLQGELMARGQTKRVYTGPLQALGLIAKNEGLRGLQKGLGSAYIYQIGLNGCRLGLYEPIRKELTSVFYDDPKANNLAINVFCGAFSGIMGAMTGSPFYLAKTRLQSYSPVFPVGTQHNYKNFVDGFRQVVRTEGFRGLYRGLDGAIIRTGTGSSVQLPIYNAAKKQIEQWDLIDEGYRKHLLASAASGIGVCCVMQGPDVIMTRMYNQAGHNLYKNPLDCLVKTVRAEGIGALYKVINCTPIANSRDFWLICFALVHTLY